MIPSWCKNYVGLQYSEVNCWQLIMLVYKEMYGIELQEISQQGELIKSGFWQEVEPDYNTGDVIMFKDGITKRHVGIVLTDEYMLHSDTNCGVIIDSYTCRHWCDRIGSVYRCKLLQ